MERPLRWEYQVFSTGSTFKSPKDEELQFMFNELGAEGWEIITVNMPENTGKIRVVAKRPMGGPPRRSKTWPE